MCAAWLACSWGVPSDSAKLLSLPHAQCSFTAVGDTFLTNDVGLGLSNDMPLMLIEEVRTRWIQPLQEAGQPTPTAGGVRPRVGVECQMWVANKHHNPNHNADQQCNHSSCG